MKKLIEEKQELVEFKFRASKVTPERASIISSRYMNATAKMADKIEEVEGVLSEMAKQAQYLAKAYQKSPGDLNLEPYKDEQKNVDEFSKMQEKLRGVRNRLMEIWPWK